MLPAPPGADCVQVVRGVPLLQVKLVEDVIVDIAIDLYLELVAGVEEVAESATSVDRVECAQKRGGGQGAAKPYEQGLSRIGLFSLKRFSISLGRPLIIFM